MKKENARHWTHWRPIEAKTSAPTILGIVWVMIEIIDKKFFCGEHWETLALRENPSFEKFLNIMHKRFYNYKQKSIWKKACNCISAEESLIWSLNTIVMVSVLRVFSWVTLITKWTRILQIENSAKHQWSGSDTRLQSDEPHEAMQWRQLRNDWGVGDERCITESLA